MGSELVEGASFHQCKVMTVISVTVATLTVGRNTHLNQVGTMVEINVYTLTCLSFGLCLLYL